MYGTQEQCHAALMASRWPQGFVCSRLWCYSPQHFRASGPAVLAVLDLAAHSAAGTIQTCLMLRAAFKLLLRRTEGLMLSVVEVLGCGLAAPDHSSVSRRAAKLRSITRDALPSGPLHVLIDSRGLKVFGTSEWLAEKHGRRSRCTWRWTPRAARSWPQR